MEKYKNTWDSEIIFADEVLIKYAPKLYNDRSDELFFATHRYLKGNGYIVGNLHAFQLFEILERDNKAQFCYWIDELERKFIIDVKPLKP